MARKNNESINNTNEVTIVNHSNFAPEMLNNIKLREKVIEIQMETLKGRKAQNISGLKIAEKYFDIVNGELFKDDFTTLDKFADYMGISPQNLSNMVNAMEFVKEHGKEYPKGLLSVAKACVLRTAEKKGVREQFHNWMDENGIGMENLADATMKKVWSAFRESHPELIAPAKQGKSSKKIDTKEPAVATDNTLEGGEKMVTIQYGNKVFSVPVKAWKAFLKENAKA